VVVSFDVELGFPRDTRDERELFLRWLRFLRGAVIRKVEASATAADAGVSCASS